jgi:hypothetical protein
MGLGERRGILRPSGTELWGALRPHACAWDFILAPLRGGEGVVVEESASTGGGVGGGFFAGVEKPSGKSQTKFKDQSINDQTSAGVRCFGH